jgi:hypothetical protein
MPPEGGIAVAVSHEKMKVRPSPPSLGRAGLCHLTVVGERELANRVVRGFLVLG